MRYRDRKFETYVILGNSKLTPLWHWSQWQKAAALFQPLSCVPRGPAGIRTFQRSRTAETLRFGRLSWKDESHIKWTHYSPVTAKQSKHWTFDNMEAWVPSWGICERQNMAPDFYFQINNEAEDNPRFNPTIIAAAGVSMSSDYLRRFRAAVRCLAELVESRLFVWKRRAWGRPSPWDSGGDSFTDAIMDLHMTGRLLKLNAHHRTTDSSILIEKWRPVC